MCGGRGNRPPSPFKTLAIGLTVQLDPLSQNLETSRGMNVLNFKPADSCTYDLLALGEVMLRLDPGEGRIRCARDFKVWEGGGEYNVARGLRRCFGLRTAICTAFADNEERKQARLKSIDFIQTHDAISFLRTSIPGLFADRFKKEHAEVVEKLIDAGTSFSNETLVQYQKAMLNRPERKRTLQKTNLPVLFIIGEKDQAIPLQQSLAQCHLPAIASVHILPNAGHMGMLEESELCTDAVISFLNNV